MSVTIRPNSGRRQGVRTLAFAVTVGAASLVSCAPDRDDGPATTAPTDADTDADTGSGPGSDEGDEAATIEADGAVAAAVAVEATGCGPRVADGGGAVVDDRLVVTAAHVVAGATGLEVVALDGRSHAEIVWIDPDLDIAVLRLDRAVGTPIRLRPSEATTGERGIIAVPERSASPAADDADTDDASSTVGEMEPLRAGRGDGGAPPPVEITVRAVEVLRTVDIATTDIYLDDEVVRPGFEIAADVVRGDSGAVVVLPGGAAGVVWARSRRQDDRAWAVDLPDVLLDPAARTDLLLADPPAPLPCP